MNRSCWQNWRNNMEIGKYTKSRAAREAELRREGDALVRDAESKAPMIQKAIEALDDIAASAVAPLYPAMQYGGSLIKAGTRMFRIIDGQERILRAKVDLWDIEPNTPENAPELWETVMYREGYRIIPDVITAVNPFALGEIGWWGDTLMESLYGTNVWTPADAPEMWAEVTE